MHRRAADDAWQTAIRTEPQMFFFSVIIGKVRHCADIPQHFGPKRMLIRAMWLAPIAVRQLITYNHDAGMSTKDSLYGFAKRPESQCEMARFAV